MRDISDFLSRKYIFFLVAAILVFSLFYGYSGSFKGVEKPNVVFITLDATRADHMPCYGYERNTTYYTCQIAQDGVLFRNAFSPASHTKLSLPSIAMGKYPNRIGVYGGNVSYIRDNFTSISEDFKDAGYETSYYNTQAFSPRARNFFQGVENVFHNRRNKTRIIDFVSKVERSEPQFIRIHSFGSHSPYTPSENYISEYGLKYLDSVNETQGNIYSSKFTGNRTYVRNSYDETMRYIDMVVVKQTIQELKSEGEYRDSLIVISSDHGQMLGEDGLFGHSGGILRKETLKVPLIIKLPGNMRQNTVISKKVSLIDIPPTLARFTGVEKESDPEKGLFKKERDFIFAQDEGVAAIGDDNSFMVWDRRTEEYELINGSETHYSELKNAIETYRSKGISEIILERDQQLKSRLEELGYM